MLDVNIVDPFTGKMIALITPSAGIVVIKARPPLTLTACSPQFAHFMPVILLLAFLPAPSVFVLEQSEAILTDRHPSAGQFSFDNLRQ